MLQLAFASLWNRRTVAILTAFSIALSVALLLSVEKLRRDARSSFANTISGVDLVVGARSGSVQLLLYSIFRLGNATNNISWASYDALRKDRNVAWTIPFSLGDSHRGFRVLGTTEEYFEHYRYARKQPLVLQEGQRFESTFEAVVGSEIAERLHYRVGQKIVLAHGAGDVSFIEHGDKPFTISGILAPTGTPVDRTVHISLAGMDALHEGWEDGAPRSGIGSMLNLGGPATKDPQAITAFLIGLKSRTAVFRVQRRINEYRKEPLLAILPGVALQELWDVMRLAEDALFVVSIMVVATGLLGMLVVILASLDARRREMAILRAVGAGPRHIAGLFLCEAAMLTAAGIIAGIVLHLVVVALASSWAQASLGLAIHPAIPPVRDLTILGGIFVAGLAVGALPALRAYRTSLADGLSIRI